MASITIRDIPDDLLEKLRTMARVERRSLNSQVLVLLEGVLDNWSTDTRSAGRTRRIAVDAQVALWAKLAAEWEDDRSADEIVQDIIANRTRGRDVRL